MIALKRIGVSLIAIIGVLIVISFFLPSKMNLEVSMSVAAPVEEVFQQVNNVKNWQKWSPWAHEYEDIKFNYGEVTVGQGASFTWETKRAGNGSLSIMESKSPQHIRTEMQFGERKRYNGEWRFEQNGDSTKVLWAVHTSVGNNPFDKYTVLFMKGMIRSDFKKGLENMKDLLERS